MSRSGVLHSINQLMSLNRFPQCVIDALRRMLEIIGLGSELRRKRLDNSQSTRKSLLQNGAT